MRSLPRAASIFVAGALLAGALLLAQPAPPAAKANVGCDLTDTLTGGVEALTGGAGGLGNPVGDVCNEVTGAAGEVLGNPLKSALGGLGKGIFEQLTEWVSEGSAWLIGEVLRGIDETTTPKLRAAAFVSQYGQMAQIAALMGMAMLLIAVIEGIAQGDAGMLVRIALVNLPLAFIATSVAYVVVQLLLVATDELCQAVAAHDHHSSRDFFKAAIAGLGDAGGKAGAALGGPVGEASGTVAVPLFVSFLAAILGAFAAFMVWIELLMRDAAVYVTALFMPFALAASIRPRWTGLARRTGELLFTLIGSKFVIVSIIVFAAGLLAKPEGRLEAVLCASALLALAAFAPFVLLRLVPFAEGAMSAAYNRRSAAGGMQSGMQMASDVQILRGMARSNWEGSGVTLWDAAEGGGANAKAKPPGAGTGSASTGGGAKAAGGTEAAGGAAGPVGAGVAAAAGAAGAAQRGTAAAAERLGGLAGASEGGGGSTPPPGSESASGARGAAQQGTGGGGEAKPDKNVGAGGLTAPAKEAEKGGDGERGPAPGEKPPRPAPDQSAAKPEKEER